jgi:hypothetical protein
MLVFLSIAKAKISDPAHEGVGLHPRRDGRPRCSGWFGDLNLVLVIWILATQQAMVC